MPIGRVQLTSSLQGSVLSNSVSSYRTLRFVRKEPFPIWFNADLFNVKEYTMMSSNDIYLTSEKWSHLIEYNWPPGLEAAFYQAALANFVQSSLWVIQRASQRMCDIMWNL